MKREELLEVRLVDFVFWFGESRISDAFYRESLGE